MHAIIAVVEGKAKELLQQGDALLRDLEAFGWKDDLPERTEAREELHPSLRDLSATVEIPAYTRIPASFTRAYHSWYAGCLALLEANMPARRAELVRLHEGVRRTKESEEGARDLLEREYMTFANQLALAGRIRQMQALVGSIPQYLEGHLHDVELAVAQAYVSDQLAEAGILLKAGHVRAAGAVAGVLLERHLKLLCDRHQPPLKYPKSAAISRLNDLLKDAAVYDVAQWRKVQWMGDVRNSCDHAHTDEPRKEHVADLIAEAGKFIALYVI